MGQPITTVCEVMAICAAAMLTAGGATKAAVQGYIIPLKVTVTAPLALAATESRSPNACAVGSVNVIHTDAATTTSARTRSPCNFAQRLRPDGHRHRKLIKVSGIARIPVPKYRNPIL
jgi:hypothetical protein